MFSISGAMDTIAVFPQRLFIAVVVPFDNPSRDIDVLALTFDIGSSFFQSGVRQNCGYPMTNDEVGREDRYVGVSKFFHPPSCLSSLFSNLHAPDQTVLNQVDMLDHTFKDNIPFQVTNHLVDSD